MLNNKQYKNYWIFYIIYIYMSTSSTIENSNDLDDPDKTYFGIGPYYNIKKCIILNNSKTAGFGLFTKEDIKKGEIVWKDRYDGPVNKYHKIKINEIINLPNDQAKIAIKYGYQSCDEYFITPLTQEEVDLDYSNYWNHSCDPNCLPLNESCWIACKNIKSGEELTIDYCTFDCNIYNCIDICNCGSTQCRIKITGKDYENKYIQEKYKNNFLPYISSKITSI